MIRTTKPPVGHLNGKAALVLGASRSGNMGQAIARRLAQEGAQVMIAGRDGEELRRFAESIGAAQQPCDITKPEELVSLVSNAADRFGKLDIAVNTAGLNQIKPFLELTEDDITRVIAVQFSGVFHFMQAVLRRIANNGSVIQISSVSTTVLLPNHTVYTATKAAGDVLLRALALEFGPRGIRINSIAPGPTVDTPMAAEILADSAARERIARAIPLGRLGTAADIAEAALWLAGDQSFVTGEVLQINGGRAIPRL